MVRLPTARLKKSTGRDVDVGRPMGGYHVGVRLSELCGGWIDASHGGIGGMGGGGSLGM